MNPLASSMVWPADGLDDWWHAAHARVAPLLDWAALCGDTAWGGQGKPLAVLCRVQEALSANQASAAATVYASAAAHLALRACQPRPARGALLQDVSGGWLAWPAFHCVDEQLWPAVDAQGYLRGQVDMLLSGVDARWAVIPAQGREQSLVLVLVDLTHPAVIRGQAMRTLGLPTCGINDVEFGGVPCEVISTDGRAVWGRVSAELAPAVVAMQCGLSRGSLQAALQHAATREQGGGVLLGWGEVRRMLSLMQERLRVMQGLLLASLSGASGDSALYAALHVGQLACQQTIDGVQLMGGGGCQTASAQSQRLCDAQQVYGMLGGVAWRRQALLTQVLSTRHDVDGQAA